MPSTVLLSVLTLVFVILLFPLAMLQHGPELLLHVSLLLFFAALYLHGLRQHLRPGLRRGLGYAAAALAAFISALFFYRFTPPGMPLQLVLGFAVATYFVYLVIVLHRDDELVLPQVAVRPPVSG